MRAPRKVNVDFPAALYEAAKEAAAREKKSFSDFVNASVRDALETKDEKGERKSVSEPSPPQNEGG